VNDPMRILKADHREAEKLMEQLGETEEGPERQALLDELTSKLTAHMEMEERIVYGPVAKQVGAEDEEEAEIEHNLARETLRKLREMVAMPGFGAVVDMLKGGIKHHVEEEETQLLPDLKDAVSKDEWAAMGDKIAQAKRAAGLPVPQAAQRKSAKRTAKKTTAKKTAAKKTAAKNTAVKKTAAKNTAAKKSTAQKSPAKRKATAGGRSR
jgi:hemerythrin-like domain-containing protein